MLYGNKSNSQRESGTPYIRNAAQAQFERTMKREGRIVTTYTGGTEFRAFFRTRDEHENQRETITMYYDVTAPVRPGTLVMGGFHILVQVFDISKMIYIINPLWLNATVYSMKIPALSIMYRFIAAI